MSLAANPSGGSSSSGGLRPEDQALLDRQEAAQRRTQLFQTASQEIAEKGKMYQAVHDALMAVIAGISGR